MVEETKKGGGNRSKLQSSMETPRGVTMFLLNYPYIQMMAYDKGDLNATAMVVDFEEALDHIEMTDRQRVAMNLVYVEGLNQREAGDRLGVTKQAVQRLVGAVANKIAQYYIDKSMGIAGGTGNGTSRKTKT